MYSDYRKGVSSWQLAKNIETTQTTAWFVLQHLRFVSDIPLFKGILKGFVEIDETLIGGKNKNRHKDKKVSNSQGRSYKDKFPVLGMIERNSGNLIAQVVSENKNKDLGDLQTRYDIEVKTKYKLSNLLNLYRHCGVIIPLGT